MFYFATDVFYQFVNFIYDTRVQDLMIQTPVLIPSINKKYY